MKNTADDIRFQLEALLKDATLQLKKRHKEKNPDSPHFGEIGHHISRHTGHLANLQTPSKPA